MVFQELVKEERGVVAGLVFLLRRREVAGTGNAAVEHEMEHRGAAAINPTKGTFRIRTAPPLKPPLLSLNNAPPARHSARTSGRDIQCYSRGDVLLVNGNGFLRWKGEPTASNLMILASSSGLLAAPRRKRHVIEVMCQSWGMFDSHVLKHPQMW